METYGVFFVVLLWAGIAVALLVTVVALVLAARWRRRMIESLRDAELDMPEWKSE
ncbi:hypothetical protein [Streptomyces sp. NBC_00872]|uniref:hypothetical protein n=1 Tax=Streptomyces sp. NBC_00872 TaxID=2903686 RepID=UPI00386E7F36|nr:hypothetical protein OG214_08330 [Streptomyces sp. NBC_00872]